VENPEHEAMSDEVPMAKGGDVEIKDLSQPEPVQSQQHLPFKYES
jgi:replication factor A1